MTGPPSERPPGNDETFESLLVDHQKRIYFFIRSMVFSRDDAKDLLQDVNSIIIRKRDRFVANTDFKSWAFAIARFECLSYLRKHRTGRETSAAEEFAEYLATGAEQCADQLDGWMTALDACRKLLPAEANDLLDLRYQSHRSLEEIAADWSTSVGALKQKLFRTRSQLKSCILKRISDSKSSHPSS